MTYKYEKKKKNREKAGLIGLILRSPLLNLLFTLASMVALCGAQEFINENLTEIQQDELLSHISQPDKSWKRFMLTIHDDYRYEEDANLSITAFATSFDSDPDIFIKKRVSQVSHHSGRPLTEANFVKQTFTTNFDKSY